MTLLYMYFENGTYESYKGVVPNPNGYLFDNRFSVSFDKTTKIFSIKDNPKYVQIYNDAISNISCIVGQNGSGKTTFLELLISNIAWGITSYQPTFMVSIYYSQKSDGSYEFFLQNYQNWTADYKYTYKDLVLKSFIDHHEYGTSWRNPSSTIPNSTKYIFHSLSPFDKIFYSIGVPFMGKGKKRIPHFRARMKYLGTQKIFSDDFHHEILTTTNLIKLFSNDILNTIFRQNFSYEYVGININFFDINSMPMRKFGSEDFDVIENFTDAIEKVVNSYLKKDDDENLMAFDKLDRVYKITLFETLFSLILTDRYNLIVLFILFDLIDVRRLSSITYLKKFFALINLSSIIENERITDDSVYKALQKITAKDINDNKLFTDRVFLQDVLNNQELIAQALALKDKSLDEIKTIENLDELILWIKKLKNKGYLNFELMIQKEKAELNYFYLSSGEKTMISYFANLSNAIVEFGDIEHKSFIMMIDEVELHLHPEWQRKFIEYINRFFCDSFPNVKFQFIIATHSPFVLSDIVEEQIIFINNHKSDNEHNTFGANIYDIFEKGFFLENSIGLCSEEFIKKISNELFYFKAFFYAKTHQDFYLLREYLREPYRDYDQRREEDIYLFNLEKNKNIRQENNFKYILFNNVNYTLYLSPITLNAINVIGEPTIKEHLMSIYSDLQGISINVHE